MYIRSLLLVAGSFALVIGLAGCDTLGGGTGDDGGARIGDSTTVAFVPDDGDAAVTVDRTVGSYAVEVVAEDPGFKQFSVEVQLADRSSAVLGDDVTGLSETTTLTFPKETISGDTKTIGFDVVPFDEPTGGDRRRRTMAMTLSVPDTVDASAVEPSTFSVTIEEQLTPEEARRLPAGTRAIVEGTVTRVLPKGAYLQAEGAGVFVAGPDVSGEVTPGDKVLMDGETGYRDGVFRLSAVDLEQSTVRSQDNPLPEPQSIPLDTLQTDGEAFESELVRVQTPFTIDAGGDDAFREATYSIEDSSIPLRIASGAGLVGASIPMPLASFQGVVSQANGGGEGAAQPDDGYQLLGVDTTDVQSTRFTIAEAREQGVGSTVVIEGTVTRAFGAYARIQDESGPTGASGIVIRQTSGDNASAFREDIADSTIAPGTTLRITGTTSQFSGLYQINGADLTNYEITGDGPVPSAQTVSLADLQGEDGEDYESELVRIDGLVFPDASAGDTFEGGTTYTIEEADENGTSIEFRVQGDDETNLIGEPIPTDTITYEGIVGQFNNFAGPNQNEGYQLIPMRAGDIQTE